MLFKSPVTPVRYYLRFDTGDYLLTFDGLRREFDTLTDLLAYATAENLRDYTWKSIGGNL
jgi:hypothetical protein